MSAFAVALTLANGTDHRGYGPALHLCRVHGLIRGLRQNGYDGDVVCLQHGFVFCPPGAVCDGSRRQPTVGGRGT